MQNKKASKSVGADGPQYHPGLDQPKQFDLLAAIESHSTAMTISEVAQLFQVSSETIRRMAAQKKIPAFKLGGSIRINPASLGFWLRSRDPYAAKASKALASDIRQCASVN